MIITKVVDTYYAVQCVRDTFITIKKTNSSKWYYTEQHNEINEIGTTRNL